MYDLEVINYQKEQIQHQGFYRCQYSRSLGLCEAVAPHTAFRSREAALLSTKSDRIIYVHL